MRLPRTFFQYGKASAAALLCLCLSACGGNRVTQENYQQINPGMTETEVQNLLGSPTQVLDSNAMGNHLGLNLKMATWKNGDNIIMVTFQDGRVMNKMGAFEGQLGLDPINGQPAGKPAWPFPGAPQPKPGQNQVPNFPRLPGADNNPGANVNNKVSKANLDNIQHGMTEDQVIAILGQPSNSFPLGGSRVLQWYDATRFPIITIHLRDGKVVLKAGSPGLK
jgi:hypothetical protein